MFMFALSVDPYDDKGIKNCSPGKLYDRNVSKIVMHVHSMFFYFIYVNHYDTHSALPNGIFMDLLWAHAARNVYTVTYRNIHKMLCE